MKYTLTISLLFCLNFCFAQFDTIYMAVLPFQTNSEREADYAASIRNYVTEEIDKDYRFVLVERSDLDAVVEEREYQKSEDFLDGKIVAQGKAIGAQYLLDGYFDVKTKQWTFSVYDVDNASLRCELLADKARTEGEKGLVKLLYKLTDTADKIDRWDPLSKAKPVKPTLYVIQTNIKQLIKECFPQKPWRVLRALKESGNKSKTLLIAAGSRMGLKKGSIVEILVEVAEEVDGKVIERTESTGWGRVVEIESENFSQLKIEAGAKKIKKHLKEGRVLRCRYVKK